jgi:DNA-binding transcriptional MerR regulator
MSGAGVNLDALITGTEAARLAGVSKQLVRRWRELGHLQPADPTPGRPRFRVGDVLKAERKTRRSPWSRRTAV